MEESRCSVRYTHTAKKNLKKIPNPWYSAIADRISNLSSEPRPTGTLKLVKDDCDSWRLKVGKYRIFYLIDDSNQEVIIQEVTTRGDSYKTRNGAAMGR